MLPKLFNTQNKLISLPSVFCKVTEKSLEIFQEPACNPTIFKLSSQDTNEINKEVIAVFGRERIDNLFFFPWQSEFGKEGTMWNFTFLFWPGITDRELRKLTLVRILTFFLAFTNFPRIPSVGFGVNGFVSAALIMVTRNGRGGKCLSLYPLWWVPGWNSLFSRIPHE